MAGLVYTAIFGKYDTPKAMKYPEKGVDYWMFTDGKGAKGWELQKRESAEPIQQARLLKVKVPSIYKGYDWYLWIDGSMQIQAPIKLLVEGSLMPHDFAAFKHPEWKCAYTEIQKCEIRRKGTLEGLKKAALLLEEAKFPHNFGQAETGVLARRGSDLVLSHASMWWGDMRDSTMRDQCTFMLNLWKLESYIEWFPGSTARNKWIKYRRGHK